MKTILSLLLIPALLHGETIYVSESGSGAGTGADTSNRMSVSGFNTAGNWNSSVANDGKIGPGDTVSLSGTLTTALVLQGSGTAGNYITILFESGAKLSAAYWTVDGAIQGGGNDYIIIDGGNSVQVGARYPDNHTQFQTNIECTANGEALANQQPTRGVVFANGAHDVIVRNLRTQNLYVKVPLSADVNEYGGAVSLKGTGNLMISNCVFRMGIDGAIVSSEAANVTGLVVADCDIRQVSNGIKPGANNGSSSFVGAQILRNRIDELGMWSDSAGGASHHHNDGIQTILGSPGSYARQTVVAYNWIGPDLGAYGHTTSAIFLEDDCEESYVYNNLVTLTNGHWTSNPLIQAIQTTGYSPGQTIGLIANNTIVGAGIGSGIGMRYHASSNNVVYNIATLVTRTTASTNLGHSDYNVLYGPSGDTNGEFYDPAVGLYSSFTSWKAAAAGMDPNSINQDPLLNSDGTLQSSSPARNFGIPISAIFTDDFNGNTRSDWDAGAFEFFNSPTIVTNTVNSFRLRGLRGL